MKTNSFSYLFGACIVACLFLFANSCKQGQMQSNQLLNPNQEAQAWLTENLENAANSIRLLAKTEHRDSIGIYFKESRMAFKRSEALLSFFQKEVYNSLNQPNFVKVHEEDATDIKRIPAMGYQTMEELILRGNYNQGEIQKESDLIYNRLKLMQNNTFIKLKPYHYYWIVRDQLLRVATLGLNGYDSPSANSLEESAESLVGLIQLANIYESYYSTTQLKNDWNKELEIAVKVLLTSSFEQFNRYHYFKYKLQAQLVKWSQSVTEAKVDFPFERAISNEFDHLFSAKAFNLNFFTDANLKSVNQTGIIALGKDLFKDKRLSLQGEMSCSSCHQESKALADGLAKFPKQNRNTPSLYYAGLQKAFFYDSRAGSLEGQISHVIVNDNEFHMSIDSLISRVEADSEYQSRFKNEGFSQIDHISVRSAIAAYVRSLNPFNSRFDQNMRGERNDLSQSEVKGFNLFLGKAQCGTCHFAPIFNGTVPPDFTNTELELIGVPRDTLGNQIDDDLGRYHIFETPEKKHFFKTPSVRNIEFTSPYMHNGVYQSLEQVVEFYNNGGGIGMGMDLDYQTLPSDSLLLNQEEKQALIDFMKSLSDDAL